jgi:hypothetical protein
VVVERTRNDIRRCRQLADRDVPGGFMATYQDPGGATIYVMDQATDSATE